MSPPLLLGESVFNTFIAHFCASGCIEKKLILQSKFVAMADATHKGFRESPPWGKTSEPAVFPNREEEAKAHVGTKQESNGPGDTDMRDVRRNGSQNHYA